jgi:hypothetical protein
VNEILLGLEEEADQLTENLTVEKGQRMVWTIGLSSFGVGLVLILGLFGWSKVRKLYVKRVLGMKPEVAESAER